MWGKRRHAMLEAGTTAPSFQLHTLNGSDLALNQVLEKGPALLAFFKIGCPVCQLTFPFLERMAANDAVQVLGISQDDAKGTGDFNQRFGVTFPTMLDESKRGYPVSNEFGISSVPSIFVVETDGSISKSFTGFSKRDLEELGERMHVKPFRPDEKVPEFKAG
jgi:peroxiredoxin